MPNARRHTHSRRKRLSHGGRHQKDKSVNMISAVSERRREKRPFAKKSSGDCVIFDGLLRPHTADLPRRMQSYDSERDDANGELDAADARRRHAAL